MAPVPGVLLLSREEVLEPSFPCPGNVATSVECQPASQLFEVGEPDDTDQCAFFGRRVPGAPWQEGPGTDSPH